MRASFPRDRRCEEYPTRRVHCSACGIWRRGDGTEEGEHGPGPARRPGSSRPPGVGFLFGKTLRRVFGAALCDKGGADGPCSSATCSPARRSQAGGRLAAIRQLVRTRSGTRRAQPRPRAAINGSRPPRAIGVAWISSTPNAAQTATRRALLATDASTGRTSSTRCAVPTHE